jgi:hypothetical protein
LEILSVCSPIVTYPGGLNMISLTSAFYDAMGLDKYNNVRRPPSLLSPQFVLPLTR